MKKILVVIPAYNEEENILKTCKSIFDYNKKHKTKYDIIVINDGSTDKTGLILDKNNIPHIDLVKNLGIGGAVQTGYKYAYNNNYDIAIQFDGDGQHDVKYIKNLLDAMEKDKANFVIGSRFIDKDISDFKSTRLRRVGINLISFFIKLYTKNKIYDTTSGFRACDKSLIEMFARDYPLEYPEPTTTTEVLMAGYKVVEVPVKMNERSGGVSSIRSWKNVYYMVNVLMSITMVKIRGIK